MNRDLSLEQSRLHSRSSENLCGSITLGKDFIIYGWICKSAFLAASFDFLFGIPSLKFVTCPYSTVLIIQGINHDDCIGLQVEGEESLVELPG